MGMQATKGVITAALVALVLVDADGATGSDAPPLKGHVLDIDSGDAVWLGVVGEDPKSANWTLVDGRSFEVPFPPGERATLVAIAKDRVPLAVSVASGPESRRVELRLARGLALEGTVRSEDDLPLRGVEIRVAPIDAVALEGLARAGYALSLNEARIEVASGGDRSVEVPVFARPKWETDREGAFRLGGLAPGWYFVEATAEGYVPVLLNDVEIGEDSESRLELVLFEAFFVDGQVVDREGAPVAGAEVHADWVQPAAARHRYRDGPVHNMQRRRMTGRTGDDGSFRLGPFEEGPEVEVFAISPERGSTRRRVLAPYDGLVLQLRRHVVRGRVVDAATGAPMEMFQLNTHNYGNEHLIRHANGRFEVPIDPDTESLHIEAPGYFRWFTRFFAGRGGEYDLGEIALERERTITGRVRNARTREPIAGAQVRRAWRHYDDALVRQFTHNRFGGSRSAETDTDGSFALGFLPTGADRLEVRGGADGRAFVRVVDLPPDVSHLEIELAFDSGIAGTLALADGTPAKGTVRLTHPGGEQWAQKVGDDGAFRWEGLGDGEYRLAADSDEGVVGIRTVVVGDGESVEDLRLVVEPGGGMAGAVTGLLRGEAMTVAVRDRNGRTVLGRELANGPYALRGIPDGAAVTARTTNRRVLVRRVQLDEEGEARVDLDFSGGSRVAGIVRAGGRPLGGVNLAVVPEDRSRPVVYATTDELGGYAAEGISDGLHSVQTQTGHSFDVHVEQRTTLDIELPQNSLAGTVRDGRTGRPVGGGWVQLVSADATAESRPAALRVRVASDGGFRFEGLVEGGYVVRVSHADFGEVSQRVDVAGPEVVEFHLESADGG